MIKKHLPFNVISTVLLVLLFSCTLRRENRTDIIEIHTKPENAKICFDNDSCIKTPFLLVLPRNFKRINFIANNDSLTKSISILCSDSIRSKSDRIYNNNFNSSIQIDLTNNTKEYLHFNPSKKGLYYCTISSPIVDLVGFHVGNDFVEQTIFHGLTLGTEFYLSNHSYLSINGGLTGLSNILIGERLSRYDTINDSKAWNVSLTNNHDLTFIKSCFYEISVGYGLSYSYITNKVHYRDSVLKKSISISNTDVSSLGLVFNARVLFFEKYFAGVHCLPTFYNIKNQKWQYSYLNYFDIGIRLPLISNYKKKKIIPLSKNGLNGTVYYSPKN